MSAAVQKMEPKRRSKLRAVAPDDVEPKKPKVLVFGAPGVGKTWASLDFPSCYYVDTEGGADLDHYRAKLRAAGGMYLGPEHGSLDFDVLIEEVKALGTEKHPYKTVVFDSITKVFNAAISEESERLGDKDAFGASKKTPTRKMASLIRWVNRLDMNAIFIAHDRAEWGMVNGQRQEIGRTFDGYEKLAFELHLVLHIFKTGSTRRARVVKSRLPSFPEGEVFEWSYAEFARRYGRDVIEKESKRLDLATPEQVEELNRLLKVVKLEEGTTDKWLAKAGAETFEEMDADKLQKCIDMLKGMLSQ